VHEDEGGHAPATAGRGRRTGASAAAAADAPQLYDHLPGNLVLDFHFGDAEKTAAAFAEGRPLPRVTPVKPGNKLTVSVGNLKSESQYTVGVRPSGPCADPPIAFATFTTVIREFKQISGCFIATAAYGGPMAAKVQLLRAVRDRARDRSALAAAAADLYARSSPPVADVLRAAEAGRAVVRAVLSPVVRLLENGVP
jgi:hypothetical protein